jgi:single-stranded-DNA-specific exonuclease
MAHASRALELLLIGEDDERWEEAAVALADLLFDLNAERQKQESDIMRRLDERIAEQCNPSEDRVLVIADDEWHPGVIGIAASKVVEKYNRPAILITFHGVEGTPDRNDVGRGSGRSVEGVNLIEAISACDTYLVKYGGHELAAGLSLTRGQVDEFRRAVNEYIKANETEETWTHVVQADLELQPADVKMKLAEELLLFEPYGMSNPTPVFMMRDVTVVTQRAIGNGSHVKFRLEKGGILMNAVMFHAGYEAFGYNPGEKIDILFNADINEYNGSRTVQLILRDTRYSEAFSSALEAEENRYRELLAGATHKASEDLLPTRNEFAAVYRVLRAATCDAVSEMGMKQLFSAVRSVPSVKMNHVKLRIILDVLDEMKLCKIAHREFDLIEFEVDLSAAKVDLESSPLLCRLRQQCR